MEEEKEQAIVVNVDVGAIVNELQNVQAQNAELLTELQNANATILEMRSDVGLLLLFVVVLVVYKIRDLFLSFVKKGGLKRDV